MESYCSAGECEAPTREGRSYCDMHQKRHQRGQSLTAPKAERLTQKGRAIEAALRLADTDSEDDEAWAENERDLWRTLRAVAGQAHGELVRIGQQQAKARGVHIGRPKKLTYEQARAEVERLGQRKLAADALGVSERTVRRVLGRRTKAALSSVDGARKVAGGDMADEQLDLLDLRADDEQRGRAA